MTVREFFEKYNNKGVDFDGAYGFQCVDVFKQFNREVVNGPAVSGNAVDYWKNFPTSHYVQIANTPAGIPQQGDVMIWGTGVGKYGHIAIFDHGDTTSFTSFDQNWPVNVDANGNGLGVCHFQNHTYNSVLGWLRPLHIEVAPTLPAINDQTKIDLGTPWGTLEVQAIRSLLNDKNSQVDNWKAKYEVENRRATEYQDKFISDEFKLKQIHDIAWGGGWIWVRLNKIKLIV